MTPLPEQTPTFEDFAFHGPMGALTSSGDLILETRAWREKLFAARAQSRVDPLPPFWRGIGERVQGFMMPGGMMGGGQLALNQLLVQMDGVDDRRSAGGRSDRHDDLAQAVSGREPPPKESPPAHPRRPPPEPRTPAGRRARTRTSRAFAAAPSPASSPGR